MYTRCELAAKLSYAIEKLRNGVRRPVDRLGVSAMHTSANLSVVPQKIVIVDGNRLILPNSCAACGSPTSTRLRYEQDHDPIVLPGVAFLTTTHLSLPYCESHKLRFRRRFLYLRVAQTIGYVLLVVGGMAIFFPPARQFLKLPIGPSVAELASLGVVTAFLVLSIFAIKPLLYDVFVNVSGSKISFRGGDPKFRESLITENQGNCSHG